MKPRNPVLISRATPRTLKRQDILGVDALFMVVYQGQPITIAVVDEDLTHSSTPRYQNNTYSQLKSAQNAADRLNQSFNTAAFEVKQIRFQD